MLSHVRRKRNICIRRNYGESRRSLQRDRVRREVRAIQVEDVKGDVGENKEERDNVDRPPQTRATNVGKVQKRAPTSPLAAIFSTIICVAEESRHFAASRKKIPGSQFRADDYPDNTGYIAELLFFAAILCSARRTAKTARRLSARRPLKQYRLNSYRVALAELIIVLAKPADYNNADFLIRRYLDRDPNMVSLDNLFTDNQSQAGSLGGR